MRRSNLAEVKKIDNRYTPEPNIKIEVKEEIENEIPWRCLSIYLSIFVIPCMFYMTFISEKTEYVMQLKKLVKERANLESDINSLKSEINKSIDLKVIESAARKKLKMKLTNELKYMKF